MKSCCRTATNLVRHWSLRSQHEAATSSHGAASASFVTFRGEEPKESEREQTGEVAEKKDLRKLMKEFSLSDTVKSVAREHLLTGSAYSKAMKSFKAHLLSQSHRGLSETVYKVLHNGGHVDDLCPHFLEHARHRNPLVGPVLELTHTSNLSQPTNWYPWSRAVGRSIFYHAGPTNSGKTHTAMQRFKSAKSAIYCAPLRMLAHEIFHRCNNEGVPCDLHTGEEMQFASGDEDSPSAHLACTVEMAHLSHKHVYDVAVIDEVQMIEDLQRGGAWTRALLGVPAKEVHVCGHECAIGLVHRLANIMGEEFQVTHYKRLVPLLVQEAGLAGRYRSVRGGDCVIVFSRRQVFETRRRIEAATGKKCAVVYGSLPPATRVQQAHLFNDPESECDVMVATDAVGMGLNLNIKRIVFHCLEKFDGEDLKLLTSAHTKQIAGRAGRFGMDHTHGAVTTFHDRDLTQLNDLIAAPVERAKQAGLYPSPEQIKVFSSHLPHAKLPDILKMFGRMAQVDGNYFLCDMDEQMELASKLSSISMPLMDHFYFSMAPVDMNKTSVVSALQKFAELHASGQPVTYSKLKKVLGLRGRPKTALTVDQLAMLEEQHDITDMFLWLGMRFPNSFTDEDKVCELQCALEEAIGESLLSTKLSISGRSRRGFPQSLSDLQRMLERGHEQSLSRAQKKLILTHSLKEKRRQKLNRNKKKRTY